MSFERDSTSKKISAEAQSWRPHSPHLGHAQHLCNLVETGSDIDQYKKLVKNPKFLCKRCGRVAAAEKNLCEPMRL
jgi:hypothetical protein